MAESLIFTSAILYDGRSSRRANACVAAEDGRISHVGDLPPAAVKGNQIDLAGKTIMPGMTVGHWHGEFHEIGPEVLGIRPQIEGAGVMLGTEKPPAILALQAAAALRTALHSGVMRVISASCSNNLDVQMRMAMEAGLIPGPHITPCSRHVVTTGDYEDRPSWWRTPAPVQSGVRRIGGNVFADGVPDLVKAVREEILFGAEIIKILPTGGHGIDLNPSYRGLSRDELRAVVDTAHERDKRVRAHVTSKSAIMECLQAGVDIIDHGDYLDQECIDAMVERGVAYVPSILFAKKVSNAGQGQKLDPSNPADQAWLNLLKMLPRANEAGVKIVPGDDYGTQGMPHELGVYARELEIYVREVGIPAEDVIRWTTANGAEMARMDDQTGVLEAGKAADFIVLDGDPAENISILTDPDVHIKAIVQNGRFIKNELRGGSASQQRLAS
jgi:imidazolonepropionase-like amidohydrolase